MSGPANDWMVVGTIVGPFGVRGELKVELNTDFPERFKGLHTVYVGGGRRATAVQGVRSHGGRVLIRLDGVETPEQGEKLRGAELAVPRSEAVALPEGHYYLDQLPGIEVLTTDGKKLGVISEVLRTGSNDVFVVGSGRTAILVPSTRDAIRELDIAGGRIVVEPWILDVDE